jgi:hypothetical protein
MDTEPASALRLHSLLIALCVAVLAVGVTWPAWDMFGPARRPMLQGWDDSFYYFWLPSVVIDHDVDFANQLEQSATMDPGTRDLALTLPRTTTGLIENKYPPGWALGSLPFFLIAHAFMPEGTNGFERPYLVAVWLGQLFYAAAGLTFATMILAKYFPRHVAIGATLVGWLASPLIYYQSARLSMSHSQVFSLAMAVWWITLCIRDGNTRAVSWAALGLWAALLVVTRNVAIVYLLFPAWVIVRKLRSVSAFAWLLAGAAVPVAVQLVAWKRLYGSWIAYSYGGERFDFGQLHVVEILFSPLHGWFYWHPLGLLAMGAFAWWGWRRPEGRAWILSFVLILVLSAAWPTWWLGSSFGYRGFEVATLFVMIGFAVLLRATASRPLLRRALQVVAGIAIVWNLVLFSLFLTQRIPREEPVTYQQAVSAFRAWIAGS